MQAITMTEAETQAWDADDLEAWGAVRKRAQALANETGEMVEIYTADHIVADAVIPQ